MSVIIALLLGIQVRATTVTFQFRSAPHTIRAAYGRRPLRECGSGRAVPCRGRHTSSFARFLELAKVCDFEADLAWAIGFDAQHASRIQRRGSRVTVVLT